VQQKIVEKQENPRSSFQTQDLQNPFSHLPKFHQQIKI
jgi:hypothetical protein